jgi:hypothetical protein
MNRRRKADDEGFRQQIVKAMIQELGGPAVAAKRLEQHHGISPMRTALDILGGVTGMADSLGITRQYMNKLVKAGPDKMRGEHLRKISELTKIPVETLIEKEARKATKRPRGTRRG